MAVNPYIRKPRSPGPWVTDRECDCGCKYRDFRGPLCFQEAANWLRSRAHGDGDESGGFRSRGPVLWMMRVAKLGAWYDEHRYCEVPF